LITAPVWATPVPLDGGTAFHLESKPAIDDVFGDSSDYRRIVDRFLELVQKMQSMRDEFARTVQAILTEVGAKPGSGPRKVLKVCPTQEIATPYARAQFLGAEYLRVGRELTRHHDQVREYDRLGESVGLTPDYRWKVKRVLQQYQALLTDYKEMKVAFHDQLNDELKHVGCNLELLAQRGDATVQTPDEKWPAPGAPGAPGVKTEKSDKDPEALPPTLPVEKVPTPQPIAMPKKDQAPDKTGSENPNRTGVLFYVDNTKCQRATTVTLDGRRLGEVAPGSRQGFQTAAGPHDLCLIGDAKKTCGQPGTLRRGYIHEGWTISLRCE
jgi:hypothetical protein